MDPPVHTSPNTALGVGIAVGSVGLIFITVLLGCGYFKASCNPETYGSRPARPGQTAQSRTKGLTKAVVDSLPIVRVNGKKPKEIDRDVELGQAVQQTSETPKIVEGEAAAKRDSGDISDENVEKDLGLIPITTSERRVSRLEDMTCSICLEDFAEDEDVRLLPCDHKFHPRCVDPWLENVAGSCPVCRYDFPSGSPRTLTARTLAAT